MIIRDKADGTLSGKSRNPGRKDKAADPMKDPGSQRVAKQIT